MAARTKFSSRLTPEVRAALERLARAQSRPLQAVLHDALSEYINRHEGGRSRQHVMSAFAQSLSSFDSLYRELPR